MDGRRSRQRCPTEIRRLRRGGWAGPVFSPQEACRETLGNIPTTELITALCRPVRVENQQASLTMTVHPASAWVGQAIAGNR